MYNAVCKGDWQRWAEQTGKSAREIAMAHGPMTTHDRFLAANYQAVKFSCQEAEHNTMTCNSLVLVRHTEGSPAGQPTLTTPYVGRVNVWIRHTPPWVMPGTSESDIRTQSQMIADVSWYKYKGIQPELYNCPVVSKHFLDYADGNYEFCDNIEPVGVHVVPYIGDNFSTATSLQVIHTDVTVFKPNMD